MGGSDSKEKKNVSEKELERHESKKSSISSSDRVKLQLKMQRDNLRAAMNKYERVGKLEREKAKELLLAGNRRKALYCLKCEKIQQDRISKLSVMYDNVEKLIGTIETKEVEMQVFDSLKSGKEELVKLNNMLKIEDIEKLMADTEESIEEAKQIDDILTQPIDNRIVDDDELLRELDDQMVQEDEDISNLNKFKVPDSKPASKVRVPEKENERVLVNA